MAFARSAAARSLQSSLRPSARRALPRLSAPARTQLVQRRYASGGHGGHAESSDIPWLLGAIAVTIPSCYYLWPSSSHAEHHGDGHGHDEHHAESEGGEGEREEKGGDDEAAPEGGEEQGGEEKSDKGAGKEDASADSDKKFEEKEAKEQDSEPSKEKEGEVEEPTEKQEDEEKKEEDSESTEPDMKADDSKRTVDLGNSRKMKKLPDSGQNIGIQENEDGSEKYHSGAKHTLPIQDDPSKSKKGEGSPETAKMHGTVDPARPAR